MVMLSGVWNKKHVFYKLKDEYNTSGVDELVLWFGDLNEHFS